MAASGATAVVAETLEPQTRSRSSVVLIEAAIANLKPFQPLPAALTAADIQAVIEIAEDDLQPGGYDAIKAFVGDVIAFARAFDLAFGTDVAEIAKTYAAALADIPADLLVLAIARLRQTWRWARIPLPADVRAVVETELSCRRMLLSRALWARTQLLKRTPQPAIAAGAGVESSTSIDARATFIGPLP